MRVYVSLYQGEAEKEYIGYPITAEGLRDAWDTLTTKCVNGHRYSLSTWQFDLPWAGQLSRARELIRDGKAKELRQHPERGCDLSSAARAARLRPLWRRIVRRITGSADGISYGHVGHPAP